MGFYGSDISCVRGGRVVFQNISFEVQSGQILHLTGANGSGKSSLLRIMSGLLDPLAGRIVFDGEAPETVLVTQQDALKPSLSVLENLAFWSDLMESDRGRLGYALETMELAALAHRPARLLSQGQRRRLCLAKLFLKNARALWLLDEPMAGLDRAAERKLAGAISTHVQAGGIAVVATHHDIDYPNAPPVRTLRLS